MGQCCLRSNDERVKDTKTANGDSIDGFPAVKVVDPVPEHERCDHVRELAACVLRAFESSLDNFGNNPELKLSDDSEWVPWMDETLEKLKSEFNPLMDRIRKYTDEEKTNTTFLMPRNKISELGLKSYPKHEEAMKMGLLKEVEIDDMRMKLCREFNRGIHTHFISHKWSGNSPDTPDNAIFEMSKEAAHYIWFDYTCVPQDDHSLRLRHLLAIANICKEATIVRMNGNEDLDKAYSSSVWCQLEAALLQWDKINFDPQMKWTIYDWNDSYAVLPGFLDLWVNSFKNHHFFSGREGFARTSMVVSMLKAFISYHDNKDQSVIV